MALLTQGQVTSRVQALLDDPGGRRFSPEYLRPYIDQENEDLLVMLESLGAQLQEQIAIFNVPAASSAPLDLTPYYAAGQPLQYLMRPKRLDWKLQSAPDNSYSISQLVSELDDVSTGNVGCTQWRWAGGYIQATPSYTPVTLRIYFDALSASLTDPTTNITRGAGNILSLQVALYVASLNNNMGKLVDRLEKKVSQVKRNFSGLIVMQSQRKLRVVKTPRRGPAVQISAGEIPYI
jgi:hypothetical protein